MSESWWAAGAWTFFRTRVGPGLVGASSGSCSRGSPSGLVELSVAMLGPPRAMNARMPAAERADPELLGHNLLKSALEDGPICGRMQLVHGAHGTLAER